MKKILLIFTALIGFQPFVAFAQTPTWLTPQQTVNTSVQDQSVTNSQQNLQQVSNGSQNTSCRAGAICYTPLEPFNSNDARKGGYDNFSYYIGTIFKIVMSFGALSAVVLLVWGGITYIVSDAVDMKSKAKKRIQAALLGLALLTSSYLILYTINPAQLLNFNLVIPNASPSSTTGNPTQTSTTGDTSTGLKTATREQIIAANNAVGNSSWYQTSLGDGDKYFLYDPDPKKYDAAVDRGVKDFENYCENTGFMNTVGPVLIGDNAYVTKAVAGNIFDAPGKTALVCVSK